jgi:arginase
LHPGVNVPTSVPEGALDWMGVAHLLGIEGAAESLSRIGPRFPLLDGDDLLLFAYGPEQATPWEREVIERQGLRGIPVTEVRSAPETAAGTAVGLLESRCDRLLVHFDVDVIDFTDAPLSENTGRNQGLSFDQAFAALRVLLASERLAALTITELNPDHGAEDGATLSRFVAALVDALAGAVGTDR